MKLCHNDQWSCPHLWHDLWPSRCHVGVTRVKKVILAKLLLLLQFTWYGHVTHVYGSPKLSLYKSYTKKYPRLFGVKRSYKKVKFQTTSNTCSKPNGANMLPLDKYAKVFMVISSSDLWLRGQRSKKVKFQITLNGKTNVVNMLALGKHAVKVSTVTSLCDLRLRDQRSKKVKFQIRNQYKDVYQCLLADTDL